MSGCDGRRPLDVRPVPLCRGVVQGEGEPFGPGHQWLDRLHDQARGDAVTLLAGRRHGGVAGLELVTEFGGADPTGDSSPTARQESAEEEEGEPWCGAAIEDGGEVGEPLAWDGLRMRGCHGAGSVWVSDWLGNRHHPDWAGPLRLATRRPQTYIKLQKVQIPASVMILTKGVPSFVCWRSVSS